ncbi:MAG TPA: hypothetical protein VF905_11190, partial [Nitrospirota bacterium]
HFVYSITLPELKGVGETMVIDLGMTNLAASACTDRTTVLWLGGELAAPLATGHKRETTKAMTKPVRLTRLLAIRQGGGMHRH